MASETSSSSFWQTRKICLHNKRKTNCQLPLSMELSTEVNEPQIVGGEWVVPCDVVGLDSNKKTKTVKIRFHPSVETIYHDDKSIEEAAYRDALKYLDSILEDDEWSRHEAGAKERFSNSLERFASWLYTCHPHVDASAEKLVLGWSWHNCAHGGKGDVHSVGLKTMSHSLYTRVIEDENGTSAELLFEKDDYSRCLVKLHVEGPYFEAGTFPAQLETTESMLTWSLSRKNFDPMGLPVQLPNNLTATLLVNGQNKDLEFGMNQLTIASLKSRIEESLSELNKYKAMKDASVRPLNVVRNSREIDAFMIEISQIGGHPNLSRLLTASTAPLNVICDVSSSDAELATSPAESVDSGLSLSPVYMPRSFSYNRERSYSESIWSSGSLKGILKKPYKIERLARSVSECNDDEKELQLCISRTPTFEESDFDEKESMQDLAMTRKKRVSFSEKVERRLFKTGSSIDGQKKKNQKKRASRLRSADKQRRASEGGDGDTSCDEGLNASKDDLVFDEDEKTSAGKVSREDSGFVEDGYEERDWQNAVRRVRTSC